MSRKIRSLKKAAAWLLAAVLLGTSVNAGGLQTLAASGLEALHDSVVDRIATPSNAPSGASADEIIASLHSEDPEAGPGSGALTGDPTVEVLPEAGMDLTVATASNFLPEFPAFEESQTVDGITVTVSAEEGAFPKGAKLVVEKASQDQAEKAEAAVAEQREAGKNVALSYTFDIHVEDEEGNELQPGDGKSVRVSFSTAAAADANLEAGVYHIREAAPKKSSASGLRKLNAKAAGSISMTAEKLDAEVDEAEGSISVETDGFSLYTVEFTYNDLQFVMTGGTEIPLSAILEAVGLQGEASAVEVSDETLFSAERKDGEWVVLSKKAFTSEEWMKVTISDIVYEIVVTDATTVNTWEALQAACTAAGTDIEIELSGNVTADAATATSIEIPSGKNVTIDLKGYTIDRNHPTINSDGTRSRVFGVWGNLTLKDTSTNKTGKITGAQFSFINGAGVYIYTGGTFTMNGGTIYKTEAYGAKGGGVYVQSGATFIMNSGARLEHDMGAGSGDAQGGGVYVASGGSFTMNGGDIYDCSCGGLSTGARGGGIYVASGATVKIYGGSITDNDASIAGGGIYLEDGAEIELKQNVTISGNTIHKGLSSVTASNIYVGSGAKIKLTGNLTGSTPIGITTADTPEEGSPVYFADSNSSYFNASKFSSDDDSCYIAVQNSKLAVVKKTALTVSGITASNKTYDGTTAATLSFSNVVYKHNGTTVTPSGISVSATGAFNNKNAENGKTVTISGLALSGSGTATYRLDTANSQSTATANITKKAVTVSGITASNKTYDGNTTATLGTANASFSGKLDTDTLTVSGTGTFNNANAGNNKTVSISNLALGGNSASNYSISSTSQTSTTANIEKRAVTVNGITASNKTYDGNTTATLGTTNASFNGKLSTDTLTVSGKGTFSSANVGSRTVTISDLALGGSSAANYSISSTSQTSTSASITRRTVTVSGITASNKIYDGNRTATLVTTDASFAGIVNGETLTVGGTGTFDNKNVGTGKTVTISGLTLGGSSAGNYSVSSDSQSSTTANITKKTVGLTWTNTSFTYDGATHVPTATATGLVSGDSCRVTVTGAASDPGTHTATASELSNTNYQLPSANTKSFTIGRKTLSAIYGITAAGKVYDGTTAVTLDASNTVLEGLVPGDTVTVTAAGAFADADAGSDKTVYITEIFLGGADSGKYVLDASGIQTTATATISKATLTVNMPSDSKVYDGTPLTREGSISGFVNGETATLNSTGSQSNAGSSANTYSITWDGTAKEGNYTISESIGNLVVEKAPVTIVTETASKVYDNTPLTAGGTIDGLVTPDGGTKETVTFTVTGSQTNVGSSNNTYTLVWDGTADEDNYQITSVSVGRLTVTDNADEIVVTVTGGTFVYDGTSHAATVSVSTIPTGYTLEELGSDATATDVTASPVAAEVDRLKITRDFDGADATNYLTITRYPGKISVTPAPLTVTTPDGSKVYDGTALTAEGSLSGLVNGETAELVTTGTQTEVGGSSNDYYINWNGTAKESNYEVASETLGTLTVTEYAEEITVTTTGGSFVYDGQAHGASVAVSTLPKGYTLISAESDAAATDVTTADVPATADKLVIQNASGTDVTDRLNINKVDGSITITPAPYTVTTPDGSKVYDGTALTAEGKLEGLVNGETATFATIGSQTEVGGSLNDYSLIWDGTAKSSNYILDSETLGILTVTEYAGEIMVTTTGGSFVYDGQAHGATVEVSELPTGYTLVSAASGATATDVDEGDVTATADTLVIENASGADVTDKLNITKVDGTITITPASYTVTTPDASKVYDGTALTAEGSFTGLVNGETATFAAAGSQTEVGSSLNDYSLTWDGTAKNSNYALKSETLGTLTVTEYADEITVTTTGGTFVYDGQAHGATVEVSELPAGYTLVSAASSATATNVEEGAVTATADTLVIQNASGADVTDKLNITKADGVITITPAVLTVTTPDAEKVYDGTALTAAGSVSGLVNGETVTVEAAGSQKDAGSSSNTYSLAWDGTAREANYKVTGETLGTLTVTPREVTISGITANNKTYDRSANIVLNYDSVVISGLVDGDSLTVSGTGTCDDAKIGKGKTVTISNLTLGGADAGNYKLSSTGSQTTTTVDIEAARSGGGSAGSTHRKGYVGAVGGDWHQGGTNWTYTFGDGHSATGWNYLYYNGRSDWYYFGTGDALMQTGWIDWEGNRYYLDPVSDGWKGSMFTGWHLIDGKWYYFETRAGMNQGRMYRNEYTPDGYWVGDDGVWAG